MAKKKDVRRIFLFSFLTISLGLISSIWIDGVIDKEVARPGYYRNTAEVDESFYMTATAVYHNYSLGTPMPTNASHSDHSEVDTGDTISYTPSPTIDWDAEEQDQ
jgi:hypothetical protein